MADGYAQATGKPGLSTCIQRRRGNALGNLYHRAEEQDAAGDHRRASRPARSCRYGPFLCRARDRIPAAVCQMSVEPARAEDVPLAIARAYHDAMTPPMRPGLRLDPDRRLARPRSVEARRVSRELGPVPDAMITLLAALDGEQAPALVLGPAVDRAGAVDLMVGSPKRRAPVWISPLSARESFPERHPQFSGFLHASPGPAIRCARGHAFLVVTARRCSPFMSRAMPRSSTAPPRSSRSPTTRTPPPSRRRVPASSRP